MGYLKKCVACLTMAAMMATSSQCLGDSLDPALDIDGDICCYTDSCCAANLNPYWAILGLGVVAAVGVILKNSACDAGHHSAHL